MFTFTDRVKISGAARITPEGYLVADALVARANNIQIYTAGELGLTDRAAHETVRVFRPEAEVFATDSLQSASRLPITLDHPPVMVDSKNWREFAKGETGETVLRDGEFLRVPLRVTDAAAVSSVTRDRPEFSLGYNADLKLTPGSHNGQMYDAVMTTIRYNHLAACSAARGGSELRIVDERPATHRQPEGNPMPKIVIIDGVPVDVASPEIAEVALSNAIKARDTALEAVTAAQKAVSERDATIAARDAEIVTLKDAADKAKLTPSQLRDAVAGFTRVSAQAKALGFTVTDSMGEAEIRAGVVKAKLGDKAANYTPEQVNAAFDILALSVADASPTDPLAAVLRDGQPANVTDAQTAFADARKKRLERYASGHAGAAK